MLKPIDKASELVNTYLSINKGGIRKAKESAITCVDELLNDSVFDANYWLEVKEQIKSI